MSPRSFTFLVGVLVIGAVLGTPAEATRKLRAPAFAPGSRGARDAAAIRTFSQIFALVFNLNDAMLQPTLFVPGGKRILLGQTRAVGRSQIEAALTPFFASVRRRRLFRRTVAVTPAGKYMGSPLYREIGRYVLITTMKNGKTVRETGRVWTFWTVSPRMQPKVVRIVVRRNV